MLSIFSTLKPFEKEHIAIIQKNAITSWTKLTPRCEIILMGNEKGVKTITKKFHALYVPHIQKNIAGLPLVSSLFKEAEARASFPLLCYTNGDIIFMNDILEAIKSITGNYASFLAVGRRRDITIKKPLSFSSGWRRRLVTFVKKEGILHGWSGIDYLVFPKGLFKNIPPLVVGRAGWDNWMIYSARLRHIPVIDITENAMAAHQNHDLPKTLKIAKRFIDESAKNNIYHAGGYINLFTIRDADWLFDGKTIKRKRFAGLSLFYPWRILLSWKRKIQQLILL